MRTLRTTALALAVLSLLLSSSMATLAETTDTTQRIGHVSGSLNVSQLPGGDWSVEDRTYQYRDFPTSAPLWRVNDQRVAGHVISAWNWDVNADGAHPTPVWGTMSITGNDWAWRGTFTGVRYADFEPVEVRATLLGEGAYDGLGAKLDITATGMASGETWIVDGVVFPLPMDS
jgi:hypothetical protein